jgi:hypothetical protein
VIYKAVCKVTDTTFQKYCIIWYDKRRLGSDEMWILAQIETQISVEEFLYIFCNNTRIVMHSLLLPKVSICQGTVLCQSQAVLVAQNWFAWCPVILR